MHTSVDKMSAQPVSSRRRPRATVYPVLGGISISHVCNDMMQSVLVAIYPLLKGGFDLEFWQVGVITLTFQLTASLLQPIVGHVTDRKPMPWTLPMAMGSTMCGVLVLAFAPNYALLLVAAALIGMGSSLFHPQSARVARMAAGGHFGLAQSVFQIGGNVGQALGPLLAVWIVLGHGRANVAWFALAALIAMVLLSQVAGWYRRHLGDRAQRKLAATPPPVASRRLVARTITVLMLLIFSKFFYLASISTFYEFYLIHHFGVSLGNAQFHLFIFLFAVAAGTLIGGPIGDRIGRKRVIWASILGVAPFTLLLPHVGLAATTALSVVIGIVLSSAFPAMVVYAQELMPHRVGAVSGLLYGFSFGLGGLGAAVLGLVADHYGIVFVYQICAFLPLLGMLAVFLPDLRTQPAHDA
jgi:FSR family fosmidomycin resistance protein-like MFS transporter